jgi:hypothetical protein
MEQIAAIGRRLAELSSKYRDATTLGDSKLMQELQALTAQLQEVQDDLMASIPSKPPGTTGRPVR